MVKKSFGWMWRRMSEKEWCKKRKHKQRKRLKHKYNYIDLYFVEKEVHDQCVKHGSYVLKWNGIEIPSHTRIHIHNVCIFVSVCIEMRKGSYEKRDVKLNILGRNARLCSEVAHKDQLENTARIFASILEFNYVRQHTGKIHIRVDSCVCYLKRIK